MNRYLVAGRISEGDDIAKIVNAGTPELAKSSFKHWLKTNEVWNIDAAIYIETVILLSDAINDSINQLTESDLDKQYTHNRNVTNTRDVSFSFMIGYEIAVEFNPYDQASILEYITDDYTNAQFSPSLEKLILERYDETIMVDTNNRFELIQFFHEMCFQCHPKMVDLYMDNDLLLSIVDSDDVTFNDIPGTPR